MDDQTYQRLASRTRNFDSPLHGDAEGRRMLEATIGMAGELSEITEPIKKYIFHGKTLDREKLVEEIVRWLIRVCHYSSLPASASSPRTLASSSINENGLVR